MLKKLIILTILLSLNACASPAPLRPFEERVYDFCRPEWVKDYVGKLCYEHCLATHWYNDSCYKWEWITEEFSATATEVHNKFMNSGKKIGRPEDM